MVPGLPPPFLHTASDQKLDGRKAWERGYLILISPFMFNFTLLLCANFHMVNIAGVGAPPVNLTFLGNQQHKLRFEAKMGC